MPPEVKHVLVLEDDAAFATILRINLTAMGFSVQTVCNGCEAWEYAQRQQYDLVMTDYHVQGITGADLCRRLRAENRYAKTPIIMVTGRNRDLDLDRLNNELGFAAILTKPFPLGLLKGIVEDCLADCVAT